MMQTVSATPATQPKTVTEHSEANVAIAYLRQCAGTLKKLGDHVLDLEGQLTEKDAEVAVDRAELAEIKGLLEDFRRGIVEKDELLEKTVGKW